MTQTVAPRWHAMRTEESRQVETDLRQAFPNTDAYRYNSASIRVRIIDDQFEGKTNEQRDDLVEPWISRLSESIQGDIVNLFMFAPSELTGNQSERLANLEFENPTDSML